MTNKPDTSPEEEEIARLKAENAWRPIESAPREKSLLLWWHPHPPNKYAEMPVIGQVSVNNKGTWWNGQKGIYENLKHITHWRPLPAPPKENE